jgi:two-component system, NtrC family, response regulator GlrR
MHATERSFDAHLWANFIGEAPAFRRAVSLIQRFSCVAAPILITGETGTGKELAAHAAHYLSSRRDAPFVPVNCGALPDALVESELFGHGRGAFTDAKTARLGLIGEAEGGTLFLDEVEALSLRAQVNLLRFLQDSSFRAIGEERTRTANVRVIAASNVDLHLLATRGEFRTDLLYRLDVLSIELPPLRERIEDIALLVPHLLGKAASSTGDGQKAVSPAAFELLRIYPWPGNVRELEHVLLRTHLLCAGAVIDADELTKCSPALCSEHGRGDEVHKNHLRDEKMHAVQEVERQFVLRALAQTNGNISEAARLCDMDRAGFSRMAKRCRRVEPKSCGALLHVDL